ncbi:3-demethylubiquinone-9 3-methyltransferase [Altererythrobacter epoxidivorans]|uniref:3-demethylubiquinone-9 3-methyltransferase n=1 Tax=Altererythrobacter epoxidivorans TaxID=361183 RepID=A0A0M4LT50_9SPHN|nr:VOC family protein [Altererythrobacter epoxidivorans]ALE15854.1 3-demethylubiquinone-9 3-methyltransferase [Altererythrobacter epoxidivorans]
MSAAAPKATVCLWFDKDAEEAARFYSSIFPDSELGEIQRAPSDNPSTGEGDVLLATLTICGISYMLLNGGPNFAPDEAYSLQIHTDDQEETDRLWNAIVGNGGQESACGWCKDKWGVCWQITPRVLTEALSTGGETAQRAFEAMMTMHKIDVAAINAAVKGT